MSILLTLYSSGIIDWLIFKVHRAPKSLSTVQPRRMASPTAEDWLQNGVMDWPLVM